MNAIELVTFDLYDTLIELVPPRWDRMAAALDRTDVVADLDLLRLGDVVAQDYWTEENTIQPIRDRGPEGLLAVRNEYVRRWLAFAGVDLTPDQVDLVRAEYRAEYDQHAQIAVPGLVAGYRTFPDVNRTMQRLRAAGIKVAVISNADSDVTEFCKQLQFAHEMDLIVTSAIVGYEKPDVRTYFAALDPLDVRPENGLHIGDQPRSDVVGALASGMQAALIDRYELHDPSTHEVPVFVNLDELVEYVFEVNASVGVTA